MPGIDRSVGKDLPRITCTALQARRNMLTLNFIYVFQIKMSPRLSITPYLPDIYACAPCNVCLLYCMNYIHIVCSYCTIAS